MQQPVFRFAPSPNGHLHLGHALSALLNARAAKTTNGRFLLRIEDIDQTRCTPQLEADMQEDLAWLGLSWERPVYRQSEHFDAYKTALQQLEERGLVYRAYLTRAEIKRYVASYESGGNAWPRDPDGAPLYPGDSAVLSPQERENRRKNDNAYAVRLDMRAALETMTGDMSWWEGPAGDLENDLSLPEWSQGVRIPADPSAWGDVVLARKDVPTSYHLSVVIDDAVQGITDVIRGRDLYHATSVHRLLQELLGLRPPRYRHHQLILGKNGEKLSKSNQDTSLRFMRNHGQRPDDVLRQIRKCSIPNKASSL
jgi:glutamyl-Q tRNA(Asp) synthetase